MVDFVIACEVLRDRLGRDVGENDTRTCKLAHLGAESAQIARENRVAFEGEQTRDADEQLNVVALHIPCAISHL